jgi:lysyl-tRNA synthetase class I
MSKKESNLYKALTRIEEQLKTLQDTVTSMKLKYKEESLEEENKQTYFDFNPNCPKCGRHDYALYGFCLKCDEGISILPKDNKD